MPKLPQNLRPLAPEFSVLGISGSNRIQNAENMLALEIGILLGSACVISAGARILPVAIMMDLVQD